MRKIAEPILLVALLCNCSSLNESDSSTTNPEFKKTTVELRTGRDDPGTVWTGNELIVFGGFARETNNSRCLRTIEVYRPSTGQWIDGTPSEFDACDPVVQWIGNQMMVLSPKLASYQPQSDSWTTFQSEKGTDLPEQISVWTGDKIFACCDDEGPNGGALIDPRTGNIERTAGFDFHDDKIRSGVMASAAVNGKIVVWYRVNTGRDWYSYDQYTAIFDLQTMQWSRLDHQGAPRSWGKYLTKYEMLPVGDSLLVGGYLYFPETNLWKNIDAPSYMTGEYNKVFNGSEVLFWLQGFSYDLDIPPSQHGYRYKIATGDWSNLSFQNAPEPAMYQETLWTGSQMIVLGGHVGSQFEPNYIKKVSAYGPASDSWEGFGD